MKEGKNPNGAISVVVPNYNGAKDLPACLDSLLKQSEKVHIIVVDNGSIDSSTELVEKTYPDVELIKLPKNLGFAGGVNVGIKQSMKRGDRYVGLFNNDAVADVHWLRNLVDCLDDSAEAGIVTSKILSADGKSLDSTGDFYTSWGLPFPRGRHEKEIDRYDSRHGVFGASGGASLYRVSALKQIGLFDEDFFAYYEDVDISFRARLAGWDILFEPRAVVYHKIGATSSRIHGFATKQTVRNLPFLVIKNIPSGLLLEVLPRFALLYLSIIASSIGRGNIWPTISGFFQSLLLLPKKLWQRHNIQSSSVVGSGEVSLLIIHDLPPDAYRLRLIRSAWWRFSGRAK